MLSAKEYEFSMEEIDEKLFRSFKKRADDFGKA